MKILDIVGARPQFVKASAVWEAMREVNSNEEHSVEGVLLHTGQHYDQKMSDQFFKELGLPDPHYNLEISAPLHGAMTGQMLEKIEEVLLHEKPDWVLVYGDTNSTLAGALAARKLNIPIAHVEAGLRSFNRTMPEETNRIVTDHCSDVLFTPTSEAALQCKREGIPDERVVQIGDVMVDVLQRYSRRSKGAPALLGALGLEGQDYAVATIHRPINTDSEEALQETVALLKVAAKELPVIWPVHPRAAQALKRFNISLSSSGIHPVDPAGYFEMLGLLQGARLVLTDSGGLQKEAALLGNPVLVVREETEWVELVEQGFCKLVARDLDAAREGGAWALESDHTRIPTCYGDGCAGRKILDHLMSYSKSGLVGESLLV